MRRRGLLLVLPVVFLTLASCETSTDLAEVSVAGTWDGVGSLYEAHPGVKVSIQEGPDGVVTGSWWWPSRPAAPISNGIHQDGVIRFNLVGFPGGSSFEGRLTRQHRLEGTLGQIDGHAVFLRSSVRAAPTP